MLEEAGVIQGYEARLAPDEVGLGLTVFVGVKRAAGSHRRAPGIRRIRLPAAGRSARPARLRALPAGHAAEAAGRQGHPQQLRHPDGQTAKPAAAGPSGQVARPRAWPPPRGPLRRAADRTAPATSPGNAGPPPARTSWACRRETAAWGRIRSAAE
ncbi:hypothetical protein G6F50_016591 [Rhizopus delemar]|uniref:Uncharacterized protein n=1 Tax=Rhizopus delemar TaxID=936053 RepID=A0A9P6XSH5_9FUNG|nr:hypothetical protein G6F50_016591 [Rhizopus delemar]